MQACDQRSSCVQWISEILFDCLLYHITQLLMKRYEDFDIHVDATPTCVLENPFTIQGYCSTLYGEEKLGVPLQDWINHLPLLSRN